MTIVGAILILVSVSGIVALRKAIIADCKDGGPDHVTGGLGIFLPAYAFCALGSLGARLVLAAWQ
ncbi:hypothetical protein [Rhodobacter capsulatus]|uniref:hypothetical protein n=1 Tax=Rhodobacter capsulatus TaxID=1061 RepID=UPI0003D343DF|nr:hypothetical protein [Rhodobacter capsulatus]ETD89924.1 hypothetical protein U713_07280 [Rhodobacter capsulatus YW2]